jgi:hypothetical protein
MPLVYETNTEDLARVVAASCVVMLRRLAVTRPVLMLLPHLVDSASLRDSRGFRMPELLGDERLACKDLDSYKYHVGGCKSEAR